MHFRICRHRSLSIRYIERSTFVARQESRSRFRHVADIRFRVVDDLAHDTLAQIHRIGTCRRAPFSHPKIETTRSGSRASASRRGVQFGQHPKPLLSGSLEVSTSSCERFPRHLFKQLSASEKPYSNLSEPVPNLVESSGKAVVYFLPHCRRFLAVKRDVAGQVALVARCSAKAKRDQVIFLVEVWVAFGVVAVTGRQLLPFQVVGERLGRSKPFRPASMRTERVITLKR